MPVILEMSSSHSVLSISKVRFESEALSFGPDPLLESE